MSRQEIVQSASALPPPVRYFAPRKGQYDVAPAFLRMGAVLLEEPQDAMLFQLDSDFARYRANKLACRAERLGKYVAWNEGFGQPAQSAVARLLAERLTHEHPDLFTLQKTDDGAELACALTGETLRFDADMRLEGASGAARLVAPPYANAFDAVCCQAQEDVVALVVGEDGAGVNVAMHVCAPSRWAPAEKLGQSFVATHAPVPHFERVARVGPSLLRAVLLGEPVQRFNWSIDFTDRLNLHIEPPPEADPRAWSRGQWSGPDCGPAYMRIERQVLRGLPEVDVVIFAIRLYVVPLDHLASGERRLLASAMRSMSDLTLAYKGMAAGTRDALAGWLVADSGRG